MKCKIIINESVNIQIMCPNGVSHIIRFSLSTQVRKTKRSCLILAINHLVFMNIKTCYSYTIKLQP